jgi:phosphatidate cytidylyltransferase
LLFVGINGRFIGLEEKITQSILLLSILGITGIFLYELFKNQEKGVKNIVFQISSLVYAVLPFCFALPFAYLSGAYEGMLLISLFILIWSSDTFAYLCGRSFGKTKLFEKVSPKKTWEGFIGGAILTIGTGVVLYYTTDITSIQNWILFALLAVIFGSIGDLVESMFKRYIGIKDSGNIIPGHGGILDRMDSFMVALPVVYAIFSIFGL